MLPGKWVSSEWPVCPVSETAAPHKMGAALTYARRYALFTLVGIAGDDDLDAPDILNEIAPAISPAAAIRTKRVEAARQSRVAGGAAAAGNGRDRKYSRAAPPALLQPDQSAALRDRLLGEIAGLQCADTAESWAHDGIIAKNSLAAADAKRVEEAFGQRLSEFLRFETPPSPEIAAVNAGAPATPGNDAPRGIDKSVLT